jgi:endonuclease I
VLKDHYKIITDYKRELYCGTTLTWNYKQRYVDISMPSYIEKQLLKYKHPKPAKPVNTLWELTPFTKQCQSN